MQTNTKSYRVIGLILTLLVLVSLACQLTAKNLTADEVVDQSGTKMGSLKSYEMTMDLTLEMQSMKLSITGEGAFEQPDKAYINLSLMGETYEVVTLSKDEVYVRQSGGDWEKMDASTGSQPQLSPDLLKGLALKDIAQKVTKGSDEKIDGVDCYSVSFEMDIEKLLTKFSDALGSSGMDTEELLQSATIDPIQGKLWVGKSDLVVRKLQLDLKATIEEQEVIATVVLGISNINGKVNIPTP
jgi:hypothetical protein